MAAVKPALNPISQIIFERCARTARRKCLMWWRRVKYWSTARSPVYRAATSEISPKTATSRARSHAAPERSKSSAPPEAPHAVAVICG
eukprot:134719-Prymnesium_polylepis.1